MSDNKKYYYLKLKDNFFDSDEMVILESMPDGYKYSNILLKLYLRSLKNNGKLMFNSRIPFNVQMLATVTRHSVGDVNAAIEAFKRLGLIEVLDNGAIYMSDIQNFIGSSTSEADRKRKYRKRIELEKRSLNSDGQKTGHLSGHSSPEIEIELDKETETDGENASRRPPEDYQTLIDDFEKVVSPNLTPSVMEDIKYELDDWQEVNADDAVKIIQKAYQITAFNNCHSWSYVKGILKNWFTDNLKSLKSIEDKEAQKKNGQTEHHEDPADAKLKQQILDERNRILNEGGATNVG